MGLYKRDSGRRQWLAMRCWGLPISIIALAGLFACAGEPGREWLRYERAGIAAGEAWRLVTGHLVHLNVSHFALNSAGMALVWYLVGNSFELRFWLFLIAMIVAGIDLGFWVLEPQLAWYVGLSGMLHGILAAGIVGAIRAKRQEAWWLGMLVITKLGYEQLLGPMPGSEESAGGAVVVAAHLFGAITGAVASFFMPIRVRMNASI
jgi:rhomboid family GlyGly-CTERM serine protease